MIDCVILGGGVAGLSAAMTLAAEGKSVRVLEARPRAGGRVYSFLDVEHGVSLDNGQHLMMGCYTATLRYLRTIGTDDKLHRIERMRIPFLARAGKIATLHTGSLPHPLGIVQAVFSYSFLNPTQRLSVLWLALYLRGLSSVQVESFDAMTVDAWLRKHHQSDHTIEVLWRPITLATMNTDVKTASAKLFVVVLREIFLGHAGSSSLLFPRSDLSALFVDGAVSFIEKRSGAVSLHTRAISLRIEEGKVCGVVLSSGEIVQARSYISALPPWDVVNLLQDCGALQTVRENAKMFQPSPIVSVHVLTSKRFTGERMTGLLGTTIQWVFLKGKYREGAWKYSCTISDAGDVLAMTNDEILRLVHNELRTCFPALQKGDILSVKTIRERKATFKPSPGIERLRLEARTALPNFFLAGDWTATGLPSTIESAVRSGESAASQVLIEPPIGSTLSTAKGALP